MRRFIRTLILTASTILLLLFSFCGSQFSTADLIVENGIFFTADPDQPLVEAVAVKNTRILAVGTREYIQNYRGEKTRIVDIKGGFGCPGFNDAYIRLLFGALKTQFFDLTGVTSYQDIRRCLLPEAWNHGQGDWVIGWGWDNTLFDDGSIPNSRMLARITEYAPIFIIRRCGDVAAINPQAMKIAGITSETPNPPGGEIEKDERTGEPTGVIKGTALELVTQFIPQFQKPQIYDEVEGLMYDVLRYGITSFQEKTTPEMAEVYQKLENENKLKCRITLNYPYNIADVNGIGSWENSNGNKLRFGHLTIAVDGCMSTWSASMLHPYADMPGSMGIEKWSEASLRRMVLMASQAHIPVSLSVFGDKAVQIALDNFDLIQHTNTLNSRFHLENMMVLDNINLERLSGFKSVATVIPAQLPDNMRWLGSRLGTQRLRNAYAFRSIKAQGVTLAFGSGWPAAPMNPLIGIYAAVSRRDTTGYPPGGWITQERIKVQEAITAFTMGSAYAEGLHEEKGSLEPGKLADIVVLDRNLLEIPELEILKARVKYTIVGGNVVYNADLEP